jgi:hypothetical protein
MYKVITLIVLLSILAYSQADKCSACKLGCSLLKDETQKTLCNIGCEAIACKDDAMELSDAQFFKKLANWWKTKGKNLVEKGVNIYNKGKELGLIKDEEMSETKFFKKLANWWKTKGKNIVEKGVNIYNKGKELGLIKDEVEADFDKCTACKLACSLIKKEDKQNFCKVGCDTFVCKKTEVESDLKIKLPKVKDILPKVLPLILNDETESDLKIKLPKVKDILPKVLPLILNDETESEKFKFPKVKDIIKTVGPKVLPLILNDETESDLKIKLPKVKDILPKVLPLILNDEEEADFDKCSACKLGCSLIKDDAKKNLCISGCEAFACK